MIKTTLITLGCSKNQVDSEYILGGLEGGALVSTEDPSEAELIIVNTCGFVDQAKEESIDVILTAARLKESAACRALVVCGCMAKRFEGELRREIPEIDAVIGFDRYDELERICLSLVNGGAAEVAPRGSGVRRKLLNSGNYAYLKVSEGCDNRCSYCVIPSIRGPHRSRPMGELLEEAEWLVGKGVVELNLIAQDTTRYGADIYGRQRLHELMRELSKIEGLHWIRVLYTHPAHWYPELIRELAENEKTVKYADVPLQHISDRLLSAMNRRIDSQGIRGLIRELRSHVPGLTLRSTFIVGLPGETEKDFGELLNFVEETRFERLGAFTYSREEGTPAASLPGQVSEKVKQRRLDELMALQQEISLESNRQTIGKSVEVLVEGQGEEGLVGRTAGHAPEVDGQVLMACGAACVGAAPGSFVLVNIKEATAYDLAGEIV